LQGKEFASTHKAGVEVAAITSAFVCQRDGDTLIVTPTMDLRELIYQQIEAGAADILRQLREGVVKNVVLDFHRTDYCGSTALGFFIKLWKRVTDCHGRMAFCNLSAHEREVLHVTKLDGLWPICSSRDQALAAVRGDAVE
jgi:anti-anti-sigma factor